MRKSLQKPMALVLAFAVSAIACSESPTAPTAMRLVTAPTYTLDTIATIGDGTLDDPTNWFRRVWVCKVGTNASFEVTVNGGAPVTHAVTDGTCLMVHYMESANPDQVDTVKVTELMATSQIVLDSVTMDSTHNLVRIRKPVITGTNTITAYTFRSKGAILTFYNSFAPPPPPPPPGGGQGCTPGYWKQSQHFDSWTAPYAPNTLFSDVFANAFPGKTLLQVLGQGGGGLNALGRHTVAALLNTANAGVSYDLNTAGVISAFNAAYASGNFEAQKNIFAGYNEQGCPLN